MSDFYDPLTGNLKQQYVDAYSNLILSTESTLVLLIKVESGSEAAEAILAKYHKNFDSNIYPHKNSEQEPLRQFPDMLKRYNSKAVDSDNYVEMLRSSISEAQESLDSLLSRLK